FGENLKNVYENFMTLMAAIRRGIGDSLIGEFFSKLFNFDFSTAFNGPNSGQNAGRPQLSPVGSTLAQQNQAAENLRNNTAPYQKSLPAPAKPAFYGSFDAKYTLDVKSGNQIFSQSKSQTINLGGLQK
ncbi:hypothetical protein, partial [Escherichia coli]|uniref:hypothetical protein n=1 Tax=Escherichia coli TaxID=562 RepID=UPI00198048F0